MFSVKLPGGISAMPFVMVLIVSCHTDVSDPFSSEEKAQWIRDCNLALNEIIVTDIFTPPVAARMYAYSNIAAYEVMAKSYSDYPTLANRLNDLQEIPSPTKQGIDFEIASVIAFCQVSKKNVYSEALIDSFKEKMIDGWKARLKNEKKLLASIAYGDTVAKHIIQWMKKDNFFESRTYQRYTPKKITGFWDPTPPDYAEAIEPFWNTIRSFTLDSVNQFTCPGNIKFDSSMNSNFYILMKEVYDTSKNLSDEEIEITKYWDDNPFVAEQHGHFRLYNKKATPGGHWLNIVGMICRKKSCTPMETAAAYTYTSIAIHDGFIACWNEKYKYETIRPVTYINHWINGTWQPFLQTPPFPEYPSGHSTISASAAMVLAALFGDKYSFIDSTQLQYQMPVRSFNSFHEAALEASVSRLYGGIHIMPALNDGNQLGIAVGNNVVSKVALKKSITQ